MATLASVGLSKGYALRHPIRVCVIVGKTTVGAQAYLLSKRIALGVLVGTNDCGHKTFLGERSGIKIAIAEKLLSDSALRQQIPQEGGIRITDVVWKRTPCKTNPKMTDGSLMESFVFSGKTVALGYEIPDRSGI